MRRSPRPRGVISRRGRPARKPNAWLIGLGRIENPLSLFTYVPIHRIVIEVFFGFEPMEKPRMHSVSNPKWDRTKEYNHRRSEIWCACNSSFSKR